MDDSDARDLQMDLSCGAHMNNQHILDITKSHFHCELNC